jgi:hypothetical protein
MKNKKKELKEEYKQNPPQMGVYQIRNIVNEKILIGAALNIPGIFNRHKFQLGLGTHRNKALQAEWNEFGGESFAFEILDEIAPDKEPGHDYRTDLALLEKLWLDNLEPYGERGYNEKRKGREELLKMIAENRSGR